MCTCVCMRSSWAVHAWGRRLSWCWSLQQGSEAEAGQRSALQQPQEPVNIKCDSAVRGCRGEKAGLRLIQLLLRPGSIGWVRLWSGPEGACRPAQLTINEHGNMAALKALHHRTGLGGVVMFTSSVHLFFCAFRTWSSSLQTHAGASASPHCVSKVGFCSHTLSGTDINDDAEFIKNRLDPEQSFRKLWFLQSLSFRNVKNVSICLDSFENSCYSLHEKNKHFKWQTPLKADFVHHRASLET